MIGLLLCVAAAVVASPNSVAASSNPVRVCDAAKGDGTALEAANVQRALDECASGGTVLVPAPQLLLEFVAATCEFDRDADRGVRVKFLSADLARHAYANCSLSSPVGVGVGNEPPVCGLVANARHLPNVYGGAASESGGDGIFGDHWTGTLFCFSGMDGTTNVASHLVAWYMASQPGDFSIFLWMGGKLRPPSLPAAATDDRVMRLRFADGSTAAAATDVVQLASNDALSVLRPENKATGIAGGSLSATWLNWHTIVGSVSGSATVQFPCNTTHCAAAAPPGPPTPPPPKANCSAPQVCCAKCCGALGSICGCGALKEFELKAPVSSRYWRWSISECHVGKLDPTQEGSTINFVQFRDADTKRWLTTAGMKVNSIRIYGSLL